MQAGNLVCRPTQTSKMMESKHDIRHDAVNHNFRKATLRASLLGGGKGYVIEQYDKKTGWATVAECKNYREMMKKMREIRGITK